MWIDAVCLRPASIATASAMASSAFFNRVNGSTGINCSVQSKWMILLDVEDRQAHRIVHVPFRISRRTRPRHFCPRISCWVRRAFGAAFFVKELLVGQFIGEARGHFDASCFRRSLFLQQFVRDGCDGESTDFSSVQTTLSSMTRRGSDAGGGACRHAVSSTTAGGFQAHAPDRCRLFDFIAAFDDRSASNT